MANENLSYDLYIEEFGNTPQADFGTKVYDDPARQLPTTLTYTVRIDNYGNDTLVIDPFAFNVSQEGPLGIYVSVQQVGTPNIEVPARSSALFPMFIDIDPLAESGLLEIRIEVHPINGSYNSIVLRGTIEINNVFFDGPGIQLSGPQGRIYHGGDTAVNPAFGDPAQGIDFRIENPGTADLFIEQIELNGDPRFSLAMLPVPRVIPGGIENFKIWFDAQDVKETETFETNVSLLTNIANQPVFQFTLKVKKVKVPLEVEAIPFPKSGEDAIPLPPNALLDLKDISAVPEAQKPGVHRVSLRVWNRHNSHIYVSNFKAELTGQDIEGLKWNWEAPETLEGRHKVHKKGGVFHFDGHFDYNQFKGGLFELKVSFKWRYISEESLRTYSFILAGKVAIHKAEIRPTEPSFNYLYPPSFSIDTGKGKYYYQVEIALAKRFFDPSYNKKPKYIQKNKAKADRNFYISPVQQTDIDGKDIFTPLITDWRNMHGSIIFYRVLTADNREMKNPKTSVEGIDWKDIPGLEITGAPWFGLPCHPKTQAQGVNVVAGSRLNTQALNSDYGPRFLSPASKGSTFHPGIDIPLVIGVPLYATTDGIIKRKNNSSQNRIDLVANSYRIGYVHLDYETEKGGQAMSIVENGDEVIRGQLIGFSGKTGTSGAHLHLDSGRAGYGKNNGGSQIYSNVLKNLKYTNQHKPHKDSTILNIEARQAVGTQHKALIAFDATTVHDKDLNFVSVFVDPGSADEQSFVFDYNQVDTQDQLKRTVTLNNGQVLRIRNPQENLFNDTNLGYPFYVQPASTQVNQPVTDRFLFTWDTAAFPNASRPDASHEVEIKVRDVRNSEASKSFRLGTRITVMPSNQPYHNQIRVEYFNTTSGTVDLSIVGLPAEWTYQLEETQLQMNPNETRLVNLQLRPPNVNAILPYETYITATFGPIPDLIAKARLGLDIDVARIEAEEETTIADESLVNFGWFAVNANANNPIALQTIRINNGPRPVSLRLESNTVPANAIRMVGNAQFQLAANEIKDIKLRIDTGKKRDIEGTISIEQAGIGAFSFAAKAKVLPAGAKPTKVSGFHAKIGPSGLDGSMINDSDPLIHFFWNPAEGIGGIQQYQIVLKAEDDNKWLYAPLIPGSKSRFDLRVDLEYGKRYQFFIRAQDGQEVWGDFTSGGIFTVGDGQPPSKVPGFSAKVDGKVLSDHVVIEQINPTIEFNWQHASDPSGIERYHIVLQPTDGSGWLYGSNILFPKKTHRLATQLEAGQSYSYHIRAKDKEGRWGAFVTGGIFSIPETILPSTVPGFQAKIGGRPVENLTIRFENPKIKFFWEHASSPFGIERYHIVVQATDGSGWLYGPNVLHPAKRYALETTLKKGRAYSIHIRAKDTLGNWGPFVKGGEFRIE